MSDGDEMEVRDKTELEREGTRSGRYFSPPVDIYENDDQLTLLADVPGCDPDNFDISLADNRLTITAATEPTTDNWEPVYREYGEGHFMREFRLGKEIDQSGITAKFDNGVLRVTLPKSRQSKTRKIEIETG